MSKDKVAKEVDGRRRRSVRSKQAIIDAWIEMVKEGNLEPTALQVSERAGVGIRSVFRHFSDMESIFAEGDAQIRDQTEALFTGGDRSGSLDERILHAIELRAQGFELNNNIALSTLGKRWRYAVLRKNYAHYQRGLRKDLADWLPELEKLNPLQREMADAVASFEMWNRLRDHQHLGKKQSIEIVVGMLTLLLNIS